MSAHNQKSAFSSYYHDTWTLLKNYRSVSWSIEVSDYNLQAEFAPSMVVLPRPCWMVLKHQIQTHILNLMCTRWSGVNGCYSL